MSLRLDGVGVVHANGRRALDRVSLDLARGERLALIGPSGAALTSRPLLNSNSMSWCEVTRTR